MAPFRFAVQLSQASSLRAWRDTARKMEDLGYSTLFIPDHFGDQLGPLVALTVAAEATTKLRVGSLVFDNDYRHPLVLAKECATLDLASEGRLEVGLGAGWLRTDYEESGITYDEPALRVDRLEEAVQLMKALWSTDKVDFEGKHYHLTGAQGLPVPHSKGGPPLIIGGGSKRVLTLAVRHAQVIGINPSLASGEIGTDAIAGVTTARYAERVGWVRQAAGQCFTELELQSLVFMAQIGRPAREVAKEVSGMFNMSEEDVLGSPAAIFGTEDEIVETLQDRRRESGFSYWVLHEAEIESFAGVVARLAGT